MKHGFLIAWLLAMTVSVCAQQMEAGRVEHTHIQDTIAREAWHPDAMRAVWMGAIIPGYGQIYNRSYWKLPIVYGGFMGCAYAIGMNNGRYTDYRKAYRDLYFDIREGTASDSKENSYIQVLPKGYTIDRVGGYSRWQSTLQSQMNVYRRYRDLSVVATVLVYALSLVDAYVDAQLFDFDISPDLSMSVQPAMYHDRYSPRSSELQVAIHF